MADRYFGKYAGIVKDNRDDAMIGRIQVSVPAIFPPDELVVARGALPFGFYFVPENGSKVWIEFEGGDTGLPLWTGLHYVSGEWAEEAKANPPEICAIKTPAGHRIVFRNKGGDEAIEIVDGKNEHAVTLNKDGITVQLGRKNTRLTLAASGVTLECEGDLTINSKGAFTLDAQGDVTIKSKQAVTVEATAKLTARGNPIHLNP